MKKIFTILAIVGLVGIFASCKNNEQEVIEEQGLNEQVIDTTVVAAVDSVAVDSTAVAE